jgi:VIT1/CCC1 family predicted Fe2+/Mn2+ transporter
MSGGINSRLVRRGAITGAGAFVGGAILVLVFAFLIGGTLGAVTSLAPISTATML